MQPELSKTVIKNNIFTCTTGNFESRAIQVFNFQYLNNNLYRQFCEAIHVDPATVTRIERIPYLPISFFKTQKVVSVTEECPLFFESSGTTGSINSRHYVFDVELYKESFMKGFELFYGDVKKYCVIGLLPSYLERQHSSLVFMVNDLIQKSNHPHSGFYLYDTNKLQQVLQENENNRQPTLLIGVTYALLDFAATHPMNLKHCIVMETGGMKGRRKELTREQVHEELKRKLGLNQIHSEYGMTELLSQAYATADGIFKCPPWMKIMLRAEDDPFECITATLKGKNPVTGVINVIDLANLYSCSFIATDDVGKLYPDGSFEVLGRLDNSDTRGCGLMVL
ncbi:MAG: acyl transferase [Bacteroidetes bacterium]|nr:acyl transferase [Bacteroidota bacterium]